MLLTMQIAGFPAGPVEFEGARGELPVDARWFAVRGPQPQHGQTANYVGAAILDSARVRMPLNGLTYMIHDACVNGLRFDSVRVTLWQMAPGGHVKLEVWTFENAKFAAVAGPEFPAVQHCYDIDFHARRIIVESFDAAGVNTGVMNHDFLNHN